MLFRSQAIPAIEQSMAEIPGARGLLLSPQRPDLPKGIEWKKIGTLNYQQYSVFMMHSLYAFIETEHCLIVQDDGWVINGKNIDKFLEYDDVGAPCHAAIVGDTLVPQFKWINESSRIVIQNGGVSLRSKRFLESCNKLGLTHIPHPELWNEDIQLTGIYKGILQNYDIRFAPEDVAKEFAVEYFAPGYNDKINLDELVGIHGQSRKLVSKYCVEFSANAFGEKRLAEFLQNKGYKIKWM